MMDNLTNEIINAYENRFACKSFDKTKKIHISYLLQLYVIFAG